MNKILIPNNTLKVIEKCLTKLDDDYILSCLHIGTDFLEVSDGQILLRVKFILGSEGIESGVYRIVAKNKEEIYTELIVEKAEGEYPPTDEIIPKKTEETINIRLEPEKVNPLGLTCAIIKLYKFTDNCYSSYLLSKLEPLGEVWEASKAEKDRPLRLDTNNITVIVMQTAYNLKTTAEVLGRGGSHLTSNVCQDTIKNEAEVKRINEVVLPEIFKEMEKLLKPLFPHCSKDCNIIKKLGAGECENCCPENF